ncbi:MAG: FAD/NAD(P)-binding protein [Bryobacterales bacterium]|nr:FAD/NAD(P)-binding protein [Bryobacterales bacterium]
MLPLVRDPGVRGGDPMAPAPHRILRVKRETHDTFTLTLEVPEEAGGEFAPGQFSMLYVFGVGELPISISGDPGVPGQLVYTVRAVGKATGSLVKLRAGDWVGVRGPFGSAWPVEAARGKDVLIVAGGIGLAPLRSVIYHVLNNRDAYGRLTILYGARSPKDLLYRVDFRSWSRQMDTHALTTVDHGDLRWRGRVGVVTTLFRYVRLVPERTIAMLCGPEIMMRYVCAEIEKNHQLPASQIHLTMERNMKCAAGFCGHCQFGPYFICKDGPVFSYERMKPLLGIYEL